MNYRTIIIIYLIAVNAIGFLAMASDKYRAINSKWRIPENDLFLISVVGGSIGCISGMYVFRHKTRKNNFTIGMPFILVIQLVLINIMIRII